jgi:hypothetical protein
MTTVPFETLCCLKSSKVNTLALLIAPQQKLLKSQLTLAEYVFLKILLHILQSVKNVNLERLANELPVPIKFESRRKIIQRFLSLRNLTVERI